MLNVKFTSEQRTALKTEIANRMKAQPTAVPGFQSHTATKAELIDAAVKLGIDVASYGTEAGETKPRVAKPRPTAPAMQPVAKAQPVLDWSADSGIDEAADRLMQTPLADMRSGVVGLLTEIDDLKSKLAARPDNVVAMPSQFHRGVDEFPVPDVTAHVHDVQQTGTVPARKVFKGIDDDRAVPVYDDPRAPAVDPNYVPDAKLAKAFLSVVSRGEAGHVFLFGPAGTGKSSMPRFWAGMTGRSFWPLAISDDTTVDDFFGGFQSQGGTTYWSDGVFLKACRQPHAVILIDEPSAGRPDVMLALNGALQDREFVVPQTGERIQFADGVQVVLADNTNGRGDASGLYAGTKQMNNSLLSRMAVKLRFGYPAPAHETKVLQAKSGAPALFCREVVDFMRECRKAHDRGEAPTLTVSLRESLNLTLLIADGIDPVTATDLVIGNGLEAVDQETMHQIFNTHVNLDKWATLLRGEDWVDPAASDSGMSDQTDSSDDDLELPH